MVLVRDVLRTLRQVNLVIKHAGPVMTGARRILARAEAATGRIHRVVSQACAAAEGALGGLAGLKARMGSITTKLWGNGAGEGPRSRYRR